MLQPAPPFASSLLCLLPMWHSVLRTELPVEVGSVRGRSFSPPERNEGFGSGMPPVGLRRSTWPERKPRCSWLSREPMPQQSDEGVAGFRGLARRPNAPTSVVPGTAQARRPANAAVLRGSPPWLLRWEDIAKLPSKRLSSKLLLATLTWFNQPQERQNATT